MAADMPEIEAYAAALLQEIHEGLERGCPDGITSRRIAALAYLHEVMDPWQPCLCNYCAEHAENERDLS